MKKILNYFNYIGTLLLAVGAALLVSLGTRKLIGWIALAVGLLLLGTYFILNFARLREKNSRLNFLFASNAFLIVLLVLAILVALNYLAAKFNSRIDLTQGRKHSLSAQSIQVVKNLGKELKLTCFTTDANSGQAEFNNLAKLYAYYSDKVKSEIIDPYKNPSLTEKYAVKALNTVILQYDKKETRVETISEEAITNAIIKLTRSGEKVIYFLQGHGEPVLSGNEESGYSEVKSSLENLSFRVKELLLFQEKVIPQNCSVLVIAGPKMPLLPAEVALLEEYISKKGGKVLLLLEPFTQVELNPLLEKIGLLIDSDVIVEVDQISRFMSGDYFMPVVAKYADHAITKNFNYATMFPMARSLTPVSPKPKESNVTLLAKSSPYSWGEMNYEKELATEQIAQNDNDKPGPLAIAAAIELQRGIDKPSRMVVVGDSDFISNKYYYFQANGNFFNNIISWLSDEGDLIAIAPKTASMRSVTMTEGDSRLVFFFTIVILPLAIFILGIAVWLYRRRL
jgi:ABC-type uncharacterized transport system involved in gliding motility auxiliary subunit